MSSMSRKQNKFKEKKRAKFNFNKYIKPKDQKKNEA